MIISAILSAAAVTSTEGNIYTARNSTDSGLFYIAVTEDMVTLTQISPADPKIYIKLMSDGEVFTGYTVETVENPTAISAFARGTKVNVGAYMVLLIDAPLTADLKFGGK